MNDIKRFLDYNRKLKERAAQMRKNMTPQEKKLWFQFLQDFSKKHSKVYRQRIIGNFIVDFYLPEYKIVIEIDGDSHLETGAKEYDEERSLFLNSEGCEIIRFSNTQIHSSFEGVCKAISDACKV